MKATLALAIALLSFSLSFASPPDTSHYAKINPFPVATQVGTQNVVFTNAVSAKGIAFKVTGSGDSLIIQSRGDSCEFHATNKFAFNDLVNFNATAAFKGAIVGDGYSDIFTAAYGRKDTITLKHGTTLIDTTGTIDTIYIKMPTSPVNTGIYALSSKSAVTTVIFVAGSTVNNKVTTLAAGACPAYIYRSSNTTYYRKQ